jgi:hypothetical protein
MLNRPASRGPLSRQHAKFIDVPIADEHLDRGYHSLIAATPLGIAPPFSPQAFEIDCRYISIVSHDPSPSQAGLRLCPKDGGEVAARQISVDTDQILAL